MFSWRSRSKGSDARERTVAMADSDDRPLLVGDGIELLQVIALADALASTTELLSVCALEEDDLAATRGRGGLSELEQDFECLRGNAPLPHAHTGGRPPRNSHWRSPLLDDERHPQGGGGSGDEPVSLKCWAASLCESATRLRRLAGASTSMSGPCFRISTMSSAVFGVGHFEDVTPSLSTRWGRRWAETQRAALGVNLRLAHSTSRP